MELLISLMYLMYSERENERNNQMLEQVNPLFTCITEEKELSDAQKEYLKNLSEDELTYLLGDINLKVKKGSVEIPSTYMYMTKNTIQLSLSAIHAIGDHIEISIKKSELK